MSIVLVINGMGYKLMGDDLYLCYVVHTFPSQFEHCTWSRADGDQAIVKAIKGALAVAAVAGEMLK